MLQGPVVRNWNSLYNHLIVRIKFPIRIRRCLCHWLVMCVLSILLKETKRSQSPIYCHSTAIASATTPYTIFSCTDGPATYGYLSVLTGSVQYLPIQKFTIRRQIHQYTSPSSSVTAMHSVSAPPPPLVAEPSPGVPWRRR